MPVIPPITFAAAAGRDIPGWLLLPFALLLFLMAAAALLPARAHRAWERSYPAVALGLGGLVATWYLVRIPGGGSAIGHTLAEYGSFIALLASLFVVSGGIHLKVAREATPLENVAFLAAGAVVANLVGTTGASMVLIRPWLRMNRGRAGAYSVVFFIFVVSNVGGALTPIGDPPLFLGYLQGVPFFWLFGRAIQPWLLTLGLILAGFFWIDGRCHRRLRRGRPDAAERADSWRIEGGMNLLPLLVIVGAVFLPGRYFLREAVMAAAALASWRWTSRGVHEANAFSFGPIKEVAWLFGGIFLTIMPALDYLAVHHQGSGLMSPRQLYFASGFLSAVLDNAPTYLSFLELARASVAAPGEAAGTVAALLAAQPQAVVGISLGAVFFGAMTYLGNGPNLMVRAIARDAGAPCPDFLAYLWKYSLPILLPVLALTGWWFL